MLHERARQTAGWIAFGLGMAAGGLLYLTLAGVLPGAIAVFVEVIAVAAFVSWLLLTIVPQQVAAQMPAARVVITAPGWDRRLGGKATVASMRSAERYVSRPVPVQRRDDGETTAGFHGGIGVIRDVAPTTGDAAYDKAFDDIANGVFAPRADDPEWE
ncbi:MAG TPA: hypothetical protein VFR11_07045 [Micromonosporaceae bacterium]|nr:hypothetical protein [Micromonosporaceae bacterium]